MLRCAAAVCSQRSFLQLEASFVEELNLFSLSFHCSFCLSEVSLLLHHYFFTSSLCKFPWNISLKWFLSPTTFSSAVSTLSGRHMSLLCSVSGARRIFSGSVCADGLFVCLLCCVCCGGKSGCTFIPKQSFTGSKTLQTLKGHLTLPKIKNTSCLFQLVWGCTDGGWASSLSTDNANTLTLSLFSWTLTLIPETFVPFRCDWN